MMRLCELLFNRAAKIWVLRTSASVSTRDIVTMPADSPGVLRPLVATGADERAPQISPDGTLLAYSSNETGRHEVYVRPYPGPGARVRVTQRGGVEPMWSTDGRELYYRSPTHVSAATFRRTPELAVASTRELFRDSFSRNSLRAWDVLPDGRFVMVSGGESRSDVQVVVNWDQRLRAK